MPRFRIAALCVVLGAAAAGCATTATPTASPSAPASTTSQPSAAAAQAVALSEWKVVVANSIKAGNVTFAITNNGTIPHELLVFKSDPALSAYPTNAAGDIIEDGAGITLVSDGANIDPQKSQTRTIDLSTPGTYLFVCNIPAHFKSGMFTVVTVTP